MPRSLRRRLNVPSVELRVGETRKRRPPDLEEIALPEIELPHEQTDAVGRHAAVKELDGQLPPVVAHLTVAASDEVDAI